MVNKQRIKKMVAKIVITKITTKIGELVKRIIGSKIVVLIKSGI